jgi:hypothetical protein
MGTEPGAAEEVEQVDAVDSARVGEFDHVEAPLTYGVLV